MTATPKQRTSPKQTSRYPIAALLNDIGDVPVITKQLLGHVDNSSYPLITVDIQLTLTTPANATRPVPVIMEFGFSFGGFGGARDRTVRPPHRALACHRPLPLGGVVPRPAGCPRRLGSRDGDAPSSLEK